MRQRGGTRVGVENDPTVSRVIVSFRVVENRVFREYEKCNNQKVFHYKWYKVG